ncbi:type I restriction endonuclease subunit R [Kordiimonas sp.]|uniref:type I restriction endonuclease subunit R n=1 Tax=Kordiimonas sp. TaxID=1970157 RepID=UPI003A959A52
MNEDNLEQLALGWFRDADYEVAYGPGLLAHEDNPHGERANTRQILLLGRMRAALTQLNPDIPAVAIDEAVDVLSKPKQPSLIANNRAFHEMVLEGVPVEYERGGERIGDRVKLFDFQNPLNNRFLAVNQYTIQGTKGPRRPDVIVFINGMPLGVLELKTPTHESADIWKAYNQLQTYKAEIEDLMVYNEVLVISDGYNARVGSLTAPRERFTPWRTVKNEHDKPLLEWELEKVVRGFFDRTLFMDYIQHFILFEVDGAETIKKIAAYHQFHAVREAVAAVIKASGAGGDRRGGVVWHTQGSGKSISMSCFAGRLLQQPEMNNPTLVVVTDRNDLDGQLFQTFASAKMLLKQDPLQADSRDDLREALLGRPAGGIIFTTIQKFSTLEGEARFPILSDRSNIVVIADEAHRSQYGLSAKLKGETGEYKYGYAKSMRDALPNATFIGFTGTPIESADVSTRAVFGDYVSIYDIQDAVEDGATVKIYYESRLAKLDLKPEEMALLDQEFDEVLEDEEDLSAREREKSKWSTLEKLVGAEPRINSVAADIVDHFETRSAAMAGKAMIVGMSREICVHLYNALVGLRPAWHDDDPMKGAVKVIMTGSAADKALLQPHIYNKAVKKAIEKRVKDPGDPLKIVIVRDMWLTGFDAPCLHTMYIDKPMKGHNLMQAIARVNRVFKDKQGGLVVDYIGIANELKSALKTYTDSDGKGAPTHDVKAEAFSKLLEHLEIIQAMFEDFDYSAYKTQAMQLLLPAANYVLGLEDGKKRFLDHVTALTRANSLCGTLDEAANLKEEIAFLQAVRTAIVKATTPDKKLSADTKDSAINQIINNAVVADGVDDIFALAGLDSPDISILSDEFLDDLRHMKERNLAVELLQKLLNDKIKARTTNNVVQERKFSERLEAALLKYRNRAIETAQVIEELIAMAKDYQKAASRGEELGLKHDELAFYDAIAENESAVRELGDDTLKKIAVEITEKLRSSATIDWQKRDSVRARLRNLVRRTLRRYKYPPDKAPAAINLVMEQAETLADAWTND